MVKRDIQRGVDQTIILHHQTTLRRAMISACAVGSWRPIGRFRLRRLPDCYALIPRRPALPAIPGTFRQRQRVTHPVFVAKLTSDKKKTPVIKARRIIHGRLLYSIPVAGVHRAGLLANDATEIKQRIVLITVAIATVQPHGVPILRSSCATFSCPRQRIAIPNHHSHAEFGWR